MFHTAVLQSCASANCPAIEKWFDLHRYGLSQEQIAEAETALEELAAQAQSRQNANLLPLVNIMGE